MTSAFEKEISGLIIETLMLTEVSVETVDADASLVDRYGLDSIDFLELAMVITKTYGVDFAEGDDANSQHFASVRTLAAHVDAKRDDSKSASPPAASDEERVFAEIKAGLREMCEIPDNLTRETRLIDDLGLDSLDALDLVGRLQDTFNARISDEHLADLKTVGDVIDISLELLRRQNPN